MTGAGTRRLLVIVAVVASLARAGYELRLHFDDGPVATTARHLIGDERAYDGFARRVAAGTLERERAFYQEPLYAWTLGQVYKVFPPDPIAPDAAVVPRSAVHEGIILVQHALGVLMAVLVAALALRVFGAGTGADSGAARERWRSLAPAAGLLAGLFAALSGPAIFAESMVLKESSALLLWVLTLHLWLDVLEDRPGRLRAVLLGLALGCGVLLRGNTYLLLGAVLLTMVARIGGRRRPRAAALVLGCALLALLPATLHNLSRGDFVLSTYQAGTNAAIGQPDDAAWWRGVAYEPIHAGRGDATYEEADAVAVAEAATGRRMTGREISSWWWQQTWRHVSTHPLAAAQRVGLKLLHTFHGDEVPDVKDWLFFRQALPWLGTPLSDLRWLGPLALLGCLVLPWRGRGMLVLRGSVAVVLVSLALFYVMGRYRLAVAPSLWILAAGTLAGGARLLLEPGPLPRKLGAAGLAAGLVALGQIPLRPDATGLQVSWANLASIELPAALSAADPVEARRHRDAAVAAARQSLVLAPDYPEGRAMLIRALDAGSPVLQPQTEEAWTEAWRLLLVMQGHRTGVPVASVIDAPLQQVIAAADALTQRPGLPERERYVAATLSFAARRVAQDLRLDDQQTAALALLDLAIACEPEEPLAHVQRGRVLRRLSRLPEAEASYRRALELGEDGVELHNNLGNLLLATGRTAEAIASFERALTVDPGNAVVLENLQRARAAR